MIRVLAEYRRWKLIQEIGALYDTADTLLTKEKALSQEWETTDEEIRSAYKTADDYITARKKDIKVSLKHITATLERIASVAHDDGFEDIGADALRVAKELRLRQRESDGDASKVLG